MRVFVPYDARDPKTRLSGVLDAEDRREFARTMLSDVLDALASAGREPTVLATAEIDCEYPVRVDERDLSVAVNGVFESVDGAVAVVMADLPLVTSQTVRRLLEEPGDVVLAPGLGGGTNALVVRDRTFRVDYHGVSFRDHCRLARENGQTLSVLDSFRLAVDVDDRADLLEVLVHGRNGAAGWLDERGFSIEVVGSQPSLSPPDDGS